MTKRQHLELELSEKREELNTLNNKAELTDQDKARRVELTTRLIGLEPEIRAEIALEATAPQASPSDRTGEGLEYRSLVTRSRLTRFAQATMYGLPLDGGSAEAELRAAELGTSGEVSNLIPWSVLLPEGREFEEQRADVVTPAPTSGLPVNQATILGRVFASSVSEFLGVRLPSVAVGQTSYPVLTTGTTTSQQAKDGQQDAGAGVFASNTLEPLRLSGRVVIRVEDEAVFSGLESSLRDDIRAELADQMSKQIVNGDGTAPNVQGILTALTAPSDPTQVATFADYAAALNAGIDGLHAEQRAQVRVLLNPANYGHAAGIYRTTASEDSGLDYLIEKSGGARASKHMPDTASDIAKGLTYSSRVAGNAVAPVWSGFRLLRDELSLAGNGQVVITARALWNHKVLRTAPYKQVKFKLA